MYKSEKNYTRIIIVILIAIIAFGLAFGANMFLSNDASSPFKNSRVQDVPRIITSVVDKDGGSHKLTADVTLVFDNKLEAVEDKALQSTISKVLTGLEYDKIVGTDGIDYAKEKIKEKLSESFSEEELQGIYLSEFASDVALPSDTRPSGNKKALKGLFKNIK